MTGRDEAALEAARQAREALATLKAESRPEGPAPVAVDDPLRYCTWATLALLAWILTPPLVLVWFSLLGAWRYYRALRAGRLTTRCWLRDTRIALAYLIALALMGAGGLAALAMRIWADQGW